MILLQISSCTLLLLKLALEITSQMKILYLVHLLEDYVFYIVNLL